MWNRFNGIEHSCSITDDDTDCSAISCHWTVQTAKATLFSVDGFFTVLRHSKDIYWWYWEVSQVEAVLRGSSLRDADSAYLTSLWVTPTGKRRKRPRSRPSVSRERKRFKVTEARAVSTGDYRRFSLRRQARTRMTKMGRTANLRENFILP